jgi:uncharacterized cofD-like protein
MLCETRAVGCAPSMNIPESVRLPRPRVVALGGGTGLPVVLKSLKNRLFPPSVQNLSECDRKRLTAIVTVTDDGGSSGRLRREFDILPPGDIRNCLSALSANSALSPDLFQYRFEKGDGLTGHSLGNLLLTALTDLKGNFMEAIECCSQMMNVRGQILPSTPMNVALYARFRDGSLMKGETSIVRRGGKIGRVFLRPSYSETLPLAIDAIERADAILLGPGSLFTSVIPGLLVKGLTAAIKRSRARKIYICNLMTEPGETDGYTASDHVRAILDHTEYGLLQYVILNKGKVSDDLQRRYACQGYHPVRNDGEQIRALDLTTVMADVITGEGEKIRHDEDKLGRLLMELI